jgi:predicted flavoprotein YhiN
MEQNQRIIVIGAGAAGMMAAGRAAEMGAQVLLLEKTDRPGQKILISGNGRCNLTNARDMDSFIEQFGPNGRFLYSAFNRFFRDDLVGLLERNGVECRTGLTGKVYPKSDNARDVVRGFLKYLEAGNVEIQYNTNLTGLTIENGKVTGVETSAGNFSAGAVIVAAGGASHPQTGSDGSGYQIARALGHTIIRLRPGLVPLMVKDKEKAKSMQGVGFRNVKITAFQCPADQIDTSLIPSKDTGARLPGKRPKPSVIESRLGDIIITHFGLSGPGLLEMSLAIVDALENGPVSVLLDFIPDKDRDTVRKEIQCVLDQNGAMACRNAIRSILPKKLRENVIKIAGIPPEKLSSQVNAGEREGLLALMKSLKFDIEKPYSMDTAMVTAGGISLKEIDPRTMASKLAEGLYFCGEILDLDAGTGGYNLQSAFSTGYVAAESAVDYLKEL